MLATQRWPSRALQLARRSHWCEPFLLPSCRSAHHLEIGLLLIRREPRFINRSKSARVPETKTTTKRQKEAQTFSCQRRRQKSPAKKQVDDRLLTLLSIMDHLRLKASPASTTTKGQQLRSWKKADRFTVETVQESDSISNSELQIALPCFTVETVAEPVSISNSEEQLQIVLNVHPLKPSVFKNTI